MSDIGTRLREARIKKGLTQGELAELLQCSSKAISRYEQDDNLDKVYDFIRICECLDSDINYILTGIEYSNDKKISSHDQQVLNTYRTLSDSDKRIVNFILGIGEYDTSQIVKPDSTLIYRFPVFKQEAAAGVGILNNTDDYDMEEFQVDNIPNNAVFAMKIKGDSMYNEKIGHIKNKATVLINPKDTDYENKIVIANLDGECVCKRYTTAGNHVEFKSDNVLRQDENKDSRNYREPQIIGVVLGVIENEKFIKVK